MRKWSRVMSTPQDPLSLDRKSPNPHDTYPRDPLLNGLRLPLPKSAPHGSCTGQARGLRSKCHLYKYTYVNV
ncbi:hypothetical protein BRARA_K00835 [Brassica rapa]|uniref:Uncharacterized protein n=1 Tax=Brassica campestris TaxID=3711 RepID=A0A397L2A7_BRACM|nr:hypothetical protein BRARA_K00835 [Brassica rapa]